MAGCSVHRTRVPNDARGIALVVALLVMGLLTLLGATYLTVASTEHTIASNELSVAKSFNIAEAGLERTKARMKTGTETSLNAFLSGSSPGPNLFTNVPFDNGTYSVVISDDPDGGVPPESTDTNNRVIITSTGKFNNNTVQKQVVALVEVVFGGGGAPVPGARAAAESLSGSGDTESNASPGSFDGRNWTPPATISDATCPTIAACGTLPDPNTAVTYGAFSNSASATFEFAGGTMFGTGCVAPAACNTLATGSRTIDTSVPWTRWDSFIAAAKAAPDRTVTSAAVSGAGALTWGTAAAPEVTVLNAPGIGPFSWGKVVNGAGVLVIEGSPESATGFVAGGQLNWQGLVIVRSLGSPGEFQFDTGASGKVRIFGQLVVTGGPTGGRVELHNAVSFVKYSGAAITMAQTAVGGGGPPTVTLRSWREAAMQ